MRTIVLAAAATCLIAAAPATPNKPLDFSGFTAATTVTSAGADVNCYPSMPHFCKLTRRSVGPVSVKDSFVMFDEDSKKIKDVTIWAEGYFTDSAVTAFTAKYGSPSQDEVTKKVNKQGGPYEERRVSWYGFDGKDAISIVRGENDLTINAMWLQNSGSPTPPKVDF